MERLTDLGPVQRLKRWRSMPIGPLPPRFLSYLIAALVTAALAALGGGQNFHAVVSRPISADVVMLFAVAVAAVAFLVSVVAWGFLLAVFLCTSDEARANRVGGELKAVRRFVVGSGMSAFATLGFANFWGPL